MAENNTLVRVYGPHPETEATIKELQRSGFDINKLSIVGKDYHIAGHVIGCYNAGDRMKVWCQLAGFWGGLSGLLFGSAFLLIPGIGSVIVFGPLVSWIVRALEGAVIAGGLSALGAGLHSIGVPKNSIMEYETALACDKFLVIAHGTADEMARPGVSSRRPAQHKLPPIEGERRRLHPRTGPLDITTKTLARGGQYANPTDARSSEPITAVCIAKQGRPL